jgi:hypothetical protein
MPVNSLMMPAQLGVEAVALAASGDVASSGKELVHGDVRLLQYRSKGSLGKVARVIRNGRVVARRRVVPDFVAARGLSVEAEAELAEASRHLTVAKACEATH